MRGTPAGSRRHPAPRGPGRAGDWGSRCFRCGPGGTGNPRPRGRSPGGTARGFPGIAVHQADSGQPLLGIGPDGPGLAGPRPEGTCGHGFRPGSGGLPAFPGGRGEQPAAWGVWGRLACQRDEYPYHLQCRRLGHGGLWHRPGGGTGGGSPGEKDRGNRL